MRGLVFLHVPSCGGSGFGFAARLRYLGNHRAIDPKRARMAVHAVAPWVSGDALVVAEYAHRSRQLTNALEDGVRCITGHVIMDARLRAQSQATHAWVTMLRDPVTRFVGHFYALRTSHPDPNRPQSLEGFLETAEARRIGSQILYHFSGQWQRGDDLPGDAVERAKRNLSMLDLVGDNSDPRGFIKDLSDVLGVGIPFLHRNKTQERITVGTEMRRKIEQVCTADMELYESAARQRIAA